MTKDEIKNKWDNIYASQKLFNENFEFKPADVLYQHACLLPKKGLALDLACGLGGNAILLAQHGLHTHAWDISQHAIDSLQRYCKENSISIHAKARDVEKYPPDAESFDVICISYYLERELASKIVTALKPNGLLFYQTFSHERVTDTGPKNPKYRLQENELLALFSPLHVLAYQEYGRVGDHNHGLRDVVMLVAQKR